MTKENNFYLPVINALKRTTNLSKIKKELNLDKQKLNYYLRNLKKNGYITQKGKGWYELSEKSKNMTNYDKLLKKDFTRGHGYVWAINFSKKPKDWDKRIEILEKNNFKFKLVGAKGNTPSIKILGRKVWLCNDYIRVFDKPKSSYYGTNAIESRNYALNEVSLILGVLQSKLGLFLKEIDVEIKKEHYALIKNDLAIEHNKKREKLHVSDEFGEWLLIDDSLGEGGELENIGKKAFQTNIPMQKWWNDNKKHNFQITPTFLMESLSKISLIQMENQKQLLEYREQNKQHLKLIQEYRKENISWRKETAKKLKDELKNGKQTNLNDF